MRARFYFAARPGSGSSTGLVARIDYTSFWVLITANGIHGMQTIASGNSVYRGRVPRWRPRLRPWFRPDHPPSRLYVSERCGMCRDVAMWFARRGAGHLAIVPAEQHPSGALRRITYEPDDGSPAASGIEAIARALEHIHLGWALVGFAPRLPVVSALVQLLADASGAEPRLADEVPPSGLERSLRRNVSTHEHAVSPGRFIRALHAARRPRPRGDGRGLSRP